MAMTLITTNTSSGAATSDFTTGIDNTYKLYIFKFYDLNPATDNVQFSFQVNAAGGSGYNETMTTTTFYAYHDEADGQTGLTYGANYDQAEGTDYDVLYLGGGNGADESCAGELFLFNPSSTTYVKHFYSAIQGYYYQDYSLCHFQSGYINTTSAIDEVSFKYSSGNMDGVIRMYGVG
jgi:hypothetical protein